MESEIAASRMVPTRLGSRVPCKACCKPPGDAPKFRIMIHHATTTRTTWQMAQFSNRIMQEL